MNSITDTNTAKSGFGLITWGAQFGAIAGPTLGKRAKSLGLISHPLSLNVAACVSIRHKQAVRQSFRVALQPWAFFCVMCMQPQPPSLGGLDVGARDYNFLFLCPYNEVIVGRPDFWYL